jgi:mono/diheme cytochrome c family protein
MKSRFPWVLSVAGLLAVGVVAGCGGGENADQGSNTPTANSPTANTPTANTPAGPGGNTSETPSPGGPQASAINGKAIYTQHCVGCHGAKGEGKQGGAPSAAEMSHDPRPTLIAVVENGEDNGKMPAFKDKLKRAEIEAVVDYLHDLGSALPHKH